MNRLHIETNGIDSWRQRVSGGASQWRRENSNFEVAVSWEVGHERPSGIPSAIEWMFAKGAFGGATLLFAVAKHKVQLDSSYSDSQSDVWAVVNTPLGPVSTTIQAIGKRFSELPETLSQWIERGYKDSGKALRRKRWESIRSFLPTLRNEAQEVQYGLLHRCASTVIEAQRLKLNRAAFLVQAFEAPEKKFDEYRLFCDAIGVVSERDDFFHLELPIGITLSIGWADCPLATDAEIAATCW